MAQSMVTIRMDSELKKQMEDFCRDVGMSMTTAFTVFAKQTVRKQRIPFEIENDPFYSEANMRYLKESVAELDKGKVVVKTMEELEAMENG